MPASYSDADLETLSFHDVRVLGYAAVPDAFEIRLDVDFLVEWLCPRSADERARFRVSPATLVFDNAAEFAATLTSPQGAFSIDELVRSDFELLPGAALGTYRYELRAHGGSLLRVRASGFRLVLRAEPIATDQQELSMEQRGGVCFDVPARAR